MPYTGACGPRKTLTALRAFGAPLDDLNIADLTTPETFFIMGRAPNRIDVITTIDGVAFDEAWSRRVTSTYGNVIAHELASPISSANKVAADRPQDRADVAYLREANDLER